MGPPYSSLSVVVLGLLSVGCSPMSASDDSMGLDGLVGALQQGGATVAVGEPLHQAFLSVEGRTISVAGAEVQVFEYGSTEALEADAAQVSADGGSVGTTMISWMDTPHFYKGGRILVIYVGSDPVVTAALESTLGAPFAGR